MDCPVCKAPGMCVCPEPVSITHVISTAKPWVRCNCGEYIPLQKREMPYICACNARYRSYQKKQEEPTIKNKIKELEKLLSEANDLINELTSKKIIVEINLQSEQPVLGAIIQRKL